MNAVTSLKAYLDDFFQAVLFFKNQVVNLNIVILANLGKYWYILDNWRSVSKDNFFASLLVVKVWNIIGDPINSLLKFITIAK